MAKIVSSKFGDRRLVYLPPINIQASKTPDVQTIAPARNDRRRDDGTIMPKDYAYTNQVSVQQPELSTGGYYVGVPKRPEGNLVLDKPSPRRNVLSERVFEQLIQQANADTLTGYSQGRYPVVPAQSDSQRYLQYTNYGLQSMPPQSLPGQQQPMPPQQPQPLPPPQMQPPQVQPGMPQAYNPPIGPTGGPNPNEKHIYYGPHGQVIPGPQTNNPPMGPTGSHNPNEQHIYYGPDGKVIPGPPAHGHPQHQIDNRGATQDFAIEGLLRHGRLTAVNLFESDHGFPTMPEYLVKDLQMKYGQFELTLVRIVARGGQCYVHATPQLPMMQQAPAPGPTGPPVEAKEEYVPVYLGEDEEFDYDKFMEDYKAGKYQSGDPKSFRSQPPPGPRQQPEYRAAPIEIRPRQSEYQYRAAPIEIKANKPVLPYRDPVTADQPHRPVTEDYHWQYSRDRQRNVITRAWDTRRDIRPVENLGNPSNRFTR